MIYEIYEEAVKLGLNIDNHCSDLYLEVNETSKKLVNEYEFSMNVTTFNSAIDGTMMFDIPFAYKPYWDKKDKR